MFSVNIDKLIEMKPEESEAYKEICRNLAAKGSGCKSIGIVGTGMTAFKIAAEMMTAGKSIMFIDGDFSTSVFMGKYRLGKNLKGACEYIAGEQSPESLICKTNKDNLEIVFTGNVEERNDVDVDSATFRKLIDVYSATYDRVIVSAGKSASVARKCDGVVLIMDDADYSERTGKKAVDDLEEQGCTVLGIVLENVRF